MINNDDFIAILTFDGGSAAHAQGRENTMVSILADEVEVNVEEGKWRLYNLQGSNSLSPFFQTARGSRLLNYVARFAEARGLPGTVLSADFVRSVIVGFDEKRRRWLLGIQVMMENDEKPRFVELVRWPEGEDDQYGVDSHKAGRVLAEYLGWPLRLFGVKKATLAQAAGTPHRGPTGPLEPHRRADLDPQRVRTRADQIKLPISMEGIWIGTVRNGVALRLPKDVEQANGEAPAFNQCVIDRDSQTVRLLPPTGLLGSFLGTQGRVIKFQDIRNVELRQSIIQESSIRKDSDGFDVDVTNTRELFAVYLTLPEETVLLVQLRHQATSELARHRAKTRTLIDGDYDAEREIAYLRQHQLDQEHRDAVAEFTEAAALVIAAALSRPLAKTVVGEEPV